MAVDDSTPFNRDSLILEQRCKLLSERLNRTVTTLTSQEGEAAQDGKIRSSNIRTDHKVALKVLVVVRLEGTNVDQGKRILKESGMTLITTEDLDDAAEKAVKAASK
ncbi:hypothetical protein Droror1_Dr00018364 [Drosera rotundifolia]